MGDPRGFMTVDRKTYTERDPAERIADWPWRAKPNPSCMSMNGVSCRICEDACGVGAIRFRLQTGGRAEPVIDQETCTGCGACAAVCPAHAVDFERRPALNAESAA